MEAGAPSTAAACTATAQRRLDQQQRTWIMNTMSLARWVGLPAVLPLLAACAAGASTVSLQSVEVSCLSQYPTYSGAWHCAREQHAGSWDEYRARYVANGDALL